MPRVYDKDPYEILGIPPNATASQVKQAYHRLARQYHPDLNKDARASERMKDINWANGILSDPQERSMYDLWRNFKYQGGYAAGNNSQQTGSAGYRHYPPPPAGRSSPPYNSAQNVPYEPVRRAQNPQATGCSAFTVLWLIIILLMNISRSFRSAPQTNFYYPDQNAATQTAQLERLNSAIDTLHAAQELSTQSPSIYEILFTPTPTAPPTSSNTVLRDEYGREDLRPKILPGSQEWEWINRYFPELTTPGGLSDEVTFVYWDQAQRAIVIETRQSGGYYISVFGGNLTGGRFNVTPDTPTPVVEMVPSP
jgi:curved DNA-binding protein CbpA